MYYYPTMGKVPVKTTNTGDLYLHRNFTSENEQNVPWILFF